MDTQEILDRFANCERLPVEALRAADENREAVLSAFMDEVDRYIAANSEERRKRNAVFFIFHLLGYWREKSAYRPLARLLRAGADDVDWLLGDSSTEFSHRVMASVFDGDPQPLEEIILDQHAGEYVRARMIEALAMVTLRGELPREYAADFLRKCWEELRPRLDCFVWQGWQSAIAMLGLSELKPLILRAFACGSIDRQWLSVANFESDLDYAIRHSGAVAVQGPREYELFGDPAVEMARYRFDEDIDETAYRVLTPVPVVNRNKGIGRNDQCPCGSGKKFKRCCLDAPALVD